MRHHGRPAKIGSTLGRTLGSTLGGTLAATLVSLALGLLGPTGRAHACGGLFCNAPPPNPFDPLPVAQSGENVVFAIDQDPVTDASIVQVHIQVLYAGPADKFSWVVPVDGLPELGVGTDRLFSTLGALTQPRFNPSWVVDGECIPPPVGTWNGGGTGAGGATSAGSGAGGSGGAGPGVVVAFQGAVGPYDSVVLQSSDPAALKEWLATNGYYLGSDASGIIDDYVSEGKMFVALKLQNGKDVRAIQPLVMTFHGTEPCVPLRLTAIAAFPDMQVTVWVLGAHRAVPRRFFELKIDELRIDWQFGGSNYNTLVGRAANEAGGNAFVTEYAGPSSIAAAGLWTPQQFNLDALRAAQTPPAYIQALLNLGLANDPQTLPLLVKYIPMPDAVRAMGVSDAQFYANITSYWAQFAFPPFDLAALTGELVATIIEPRHAAQTMIDAHPYLTRLNTFISPLEMTQDPTFTLNPDLPTVSNVHQATLRTMCGQRQYYQCNAPVRLELPDGRMVWVRPGFTTSVCQNPRLDTLANLPAAEIVWERSDSGEGARRVDNTAMIQAALKAYNTSFVTESHLFPTPVPRERDVDPHGCGCALNGGTGRTPVLGAALVMAALCMRRRRRR